VSIPEGGNGGSGGGVQEVIEKNWHEFEGGAEAIWNEISGEGGSKSKGTTGKPYDEEQDALIKIAKRAKKTGLTPEEAEILREWAEELDLEFRGPETSDKGTFGRKPHYHCGSQAHIPALP
jgi:hypothetical protein